jgi:hypothetical protein
VRESNLYLRHGHEEVTKELAAVRESNLYLRHGHEEVTKELAAVRESNLYLRHGHEEVTKELAAVRSSLSWRITAPLRGAARRVASWSPSRKRTTEND